VLAVPAGINRLVETLVPPPSQQAFTANIRAAEISANRKAEELLQGYLSDHPELAPVGTINYPEFRRKGYVVRRTVERETLPVLQAYEAQIAKATLAAHWLSLLSPAAAAHVALSDAAGAGPAQQAAYVAAVRAYKAELEARIVPTMYRGVKLTADELEALPVFSAPRWTLAHSGGLLAAVFVYLLALYGGLLAWTRRAINRLSPVDSSG
jgi:ABC-2 type transport system permease protein